MYTVRLTLYGLHYLLYIIYCVRRRLHDVHCTSYNKHYASRTLFTVSIATRYRVHCTLYIVQCTEYRVQSTVYSVQCTVYSVQSTVYSKAGHGS